MKSSKLVALFLTILHTFRSTISTRRESLRARSLQQSHIIYFVVEVNSDLAQSTYTRFFKGFVVKRQIINIHWYFFRDLFWNCLLADVQNFSIRMIRISDYKWWLSQSQPKLERFELRLKLINWSMCNARRCLYASSLNSIQYAARLFIKVLLY